MLIWALSLGQFYFSSFPPFSPPFQTGCSLAFGFLVVGLGMPVSGCDLVRASLLLGSRLVSLESLRNQDSGSRLCCQSAFWQALLSALAPYCFPGPGLVPGCCVLLLLKYMYLCWGVFSVSGALILWRSLECSSASVTVVGNLPCYLGFDLITLLIH